MAKIYKRSDRIKVKIDDIVVHLAPLSIDQKTEAKQLMAKGRIIKDYRLITQGIIYTIRCALKNIEGVETSDGLPYKLEFENDLLTESCVDDLFNLEMHQKLVMVCSNLIATIPNEFTDESGNPIDGVEVVKETKKENINIPN